MKASNLALVASVILLTSRTARGQTTGSIEGRITDSTGTPLPGVAIEATSPSLLGIRAAVSGRNGTYRIPAVPPGTYRLEARLSGFRSADKNATITLDATATADLTLRLEATEQLVVSADVPLVDTSSTTAGTDYTSEVIARLPVQRNYADIVRSNPGVTADRGEMQGEALALSIRGATSVENQWTIDGINTTSVVKGFQGKALNNEFIEEVEVKAGGYQAEYGRALGGIINVITRSGGNQFRGDAFLYYDSVDTRADQIVTDKDSLTGMRITPTRRADFGADLGGFLVMDRLWFFASYNRIDAPGTTSRYVSSSSVPDTLQFPRDQTSNLYFAKLTWNIANRTTVVATTFSDPSRRTGAARVGSTGGLISSPDPGTWESRREVGGTDFGLRFHQLFGSAAVFVLQASRHRDRFELYPSKAGAEVHFEDWTCTGGAPSRSCDPPVSPNSASGGMGLIGGPRQRNASRRDQLRADLTLFLGDHEIRFGGDYQDGESSLITSYTGGQEVGRFNEFGQLYFEHDFIARSPADLAPVDADARPHHIDQSFYLQDSWKAASGLTVNVGLRWDQEDLRDYLGKPLFKTTDEWQPRLGVIWDPSRRGKLKVYASAGRFYFSLPTDLGAFASPIFFATTYNFDPLDTTQNPEVIGHSTASFSPSGGDKVDRGLNGIYQDELTVGVETLLDPTFSVGVNGTYRRLGRAIESRCDLDFTLPEFDGAGCAIVNLGSDGRYARGDFQGCNGLDGDAYQCLQGVPATPKARRLYRGIELLARKSVGDRLWIQASYVYSSLRGNYDGGVSESSGETNPGVSSDFDLPQFWSHNAYGKLFLDRPHSFRADASYRTPFGLLVGLQGFAQSGAPLNKLGFLDEGYGSVVQLVPRGTAGRLPTLWEANLTLGYPIAVGRLTVTLQAYVFNLFNNQIEIQRDDNYTTHPPEGYPATLYDPNVPSNNANYGRIVARQDPRLVRAAVRVAF